MLNIQSFGTKMFTDASTHIRRFTAMLTLFKMQSSSSLFTQGSDGVRLNSKSKRTHMASICLVFNYLTVCERERELGLFIQKGSGASPSSPALIHIKLGQKSNATWVFWKSWNGCKC